MAGDWIPIDVTLPHKAEVMRIAAATGLTRRAVVGSLVEIWSWAQAESVDGRVDAPVDALVDALESHVSRECSVVRAMVVVGWLEDHGDYIIFPRAEKWLSNGAKARLQRNLRQCRWREKQQNVDGDVDAHVDGDVSTKASTTEEKRIAAAAGAALLPPAAAAFAKRGIRGDIAWASSFSLADVDAACARFDEIKKKKRVGSPGGLMRKLLTEGCSIPVDKPSPSVKIGDWTPKMVSQ